MVLMIACQLLPRPGKGRTHLKHEISGDENGFFLKWIKNCDPMALKTKNRFDLKLSESNKVVVVGAGPAGLVVSLLLPFSYARISTLPG